MIFASSSAKAHLLHRAPSFSRAFQSSMRLNANLFVARSQTNGDSPRFYISQSSSTQLLLQYKDGIKLAPMVQISPGPSNSASPTLNHNASNQIRAMVAVLTSGLLAW